MAATSAARNRATATSVRLPISDYDRLSVKEILPLLAPLSETELQLVLAHEKATKNRVTLLRTMERIELSAPPANRPKGTTAGRAAPAVRVAPEPEPVDEVVEDEIVEDWTTDDDVVEGWAAEDDGVEGWAAEDDTSAPAVPAATVEPAPAKATRGRRARKLRKEEKAAKAAKAATVDGVAQNGHRRPDPGTSLSSVEPDIEERQATSASRPRLPAIRTSWEDEAPPVELTWELEDDDELEELEHAGELENEPAVAAVIEDDLSGEIDDDRDGDVDDDLEGEVEDEALAGEIEDDLAGEDDPAGEIDDEQEPWGIDDFPDVRDDAVEFEARSASRPTYEVEDSVEDMVPRHTAYAPPPPPPQPLQRYEFDDDDEEEDLIDDDVLPARQAPPAAAKVTPIRPPTPISAAERVIAQPLPPRPEWMKDEPTQVMLPTAPAQKKEPAFKSIKSAVVPDMPKPNLTSVLWVAAAIAAIVVGVLIGMVATRTSPPASVQMERTNSVTYVPPSQN